MNLGLAGRVAVVTAAGSGIGSRTPGFVQTFTADIAPAWNISATKAINHFVREVERIPMGRLGEGEDVAGVILFLASGMVIGGRDGSAGR
jgi:NAD(P)-dependent dehydrogenase (short-subunit alcohol dehydrogenase family)